MWYSINKDIKYSHALQKRDILINGKNRQLLNHRYGGYTDDVSAILCALGGSF